MNPQFKCSDFSFTVYVEDTDFQGVVYHANYLKYLERARSQFLIEHNLSQTRAKTIENGSYVVKSVYLEYLNPAHLEDELTVETTIEYQSKARSLFLQSILNLKNDTLICKGNVEVCFIDNSSGKPKSFPKRLLNLFSN